MLWNNAPSFSTEVKEPIEETPTHEDVIQEEKGDNLETNETQDESDEDITQMGNQVEEMMEKIGKEI